MGKMLEPSQYARRRYKISQPVDMDVALNYSCALMAIAGSDGELAEAELQWYLDEQTILTDEPQEYLEALRNLDWKSANIEELLSGISYGFPMNFRRSMLYQAIKMSRADGVYHEQEKGAVAKAAEILGIERSVVVTLESLAEIEESAERLRLAVFETDV
ncbi:hypothetical protein PN466_08515 [Roseofilum reptotaenium CS-1145]|uniref:Uncharacterized protein n=2 Tax=Roseofilum TaxID=1233426 RepID=A0A1L9QR30_9CYAN|nr:hypothetical protein [Roseofilum reptotaenium CS-1145]OJJ25124.1 hypothetical protein BI308_13110 [Roseofilum reptotaenium AO1-A]